MKELPEQSVLFFDAIYQDAKMLFDKLDTSLHPKIMILSIIDNECKEKPYGLIQKGREDVSDKPEDFGYSTDFFYRIKSLEKEFEKSSDNSINQLYDMYPELSMKNKFGLKNTALLDAIETVLNSEEINDDVISFCSYSVLINGYLTFAVLQLNKKVFNSYYKLKKNVIPLKRVGINSYSISASLLGRVVNRFLRKSINYFTNIEVLYRTISSLFKYNPGNETEIDEVIISAGQHLVHSIVKSLVSDNASVSILDRRDLFYTFNEISSLRYEGSESIGKIAIAHRDHSNIKEIVTLTNPVEIYDFSAVRKLLQITSDSMFLISDSKYIYGFGELVENYVEDDEDLFFVNFVKHYTWELSHADKVLMTVSYGQPRLPKLSVEKSSFTSILNTMFPDISYENVCDLWSLIIRATQQKHGTMVVITKEAKEESIRLQSQAIPITPMNITMEMIDKMTAIDGALLINPYDIKCYAIGAILDGLATDRGNSARGSRYNSAIRYCQSKNGECLAVVVSEDGAIDLIH